MQFLESDETVSDEEIDRMHIRDNLKAVTVSGSLALYLYLRMYILSAWFSCMRTHFPHHTPLSQTISRRRIGVLEGALIHWRSRLRPKPQKDLANQRPVTLRKRRENVKSEANWKLFYHKFACDHATSALIWNYKVRGGAILIQGLSLYL